MLCPNCKNEIDNDSLFCERCGAKVKKSKKHPKAALLLSLAAFGTFACWIWIEIFHVLPLTFVFFVGVVAVYLFYRLAVKKNWTLITENVLVRLLDEHKYYLWGTLAAMFAFLLLMLFCIS